MCFIWTNKGLNFTPHLHRNVYGVFMWNVRCICPTSKKNCEMSVLFVRLQKKLWNVRCICPTSKKNLWNFRCICPTSKKNCEMSVVFVRLQKKCEMSVVFVRLQKNCEMSIVFVRLQKKIVKCPLYLSDFKKNVKCPLYFSDFKKIVKCPLYLSDFKKKLWNVRCICPTSKKKLDCFIKFHWRFIIVTFSKNSSTISRVVTCAQWFTFFGYLLPNTKTSTMS